MNKNPENTHKTDIKGHNLNELMATKVMGWHKFKLEHAKDVFIWADSANVPTGYYITDLFDCSFPLWNPCEDMNQAMMCVKKYVEYANMRFEMDVLSHGCSVSLNKKQLDGEYQMISGDFVGQDEELPKAICEAIAGAIGGKG